MERTSGAVAEVKSAGLRSVLSNRPFLALWLAQVLSQTAQNALWFAMIVVVEETTHSSFYLGIAVLSAALPAVFLGLFAGVVVDRLSKKLVLILSNALRAVAVLGYLVHGRILVTIYVTNFLFASISQFFVPAEAATIPQLVPKRDLMVANTLFGVTLIGSQIAGVIVLGPAVVKLFGPSALFLSSAATLAVCALLILWLPWDKAPRELPIDQKLPAIVKHIVDDVLDVGKYLVADRRTTLSVLHLTYASAMTLIVVMLAPRFVVGVMGLSADDAYFILGPVGLGILLGFVAITPLTRQMEKGRLVRLALLGGSFLLLALGLAVPWSRAVGLWLEQSAKASPVLPLVMFLVALLGFGWALVSVPSETIIMERAPAEARGRVFAVQTTLGHLISALPLLALGSLADLLGINAIMVVLAGVAFVVWLLSMRWVTNLPWTGRVG
ncbi:MAG: MFS transporter [Chloroflexi bacterium]|nr:MFS transporter [Chloroflexota bacterium]